MASRPGPSPLFRYSSRGFLVGASQLVSEKRALDEGQKLIEMIFPGVPAIASSVGARHSATLSWLVGSAQLLEFIETGGTLPHMSEGQGGLGIPEAGRQLSE